MSLSRVDFLELLLVKLEAKVEKLEGTNAELKEENEYLKYENEEFRDKKRDMEEFFEIDEKVEKRAEELLRYGQS